MTKDTNPVELQDGDLGDANGGSYSPSDSIFYARKPKGVMFRGAGNDFVSGGEGNDLVLRGGAGNNV